MDKTEKRWFRVPPHAFTSDGTSDGKITLDSTYAFKVKQEIFLRANGEVPIQLEIKRIPSTTELFVGPKGNITYRSDITAFTLAKNSTIEAEEQNRTSIPELEHERAVYEEEPTIAKRVCVVDQCGRKYKGIVDNQGTLRFPVDANITVENLHVDIDNANKANIENINVAVADSEFSYTFPAQTKKFAIKVRDGKADLRLSYGVGETTTKYVKIRRGNSHSVDAIDPEDPFTIYLQSSKTGVIVEIESWYKV